MDAFEKSESSDRTQEIPKEKGICPFCKKEITPIVIEVNTIRRDKCKCPECNQSIYVCTVPGCYDYAKGGNLYDDNFCPEHYKKGLEWSKGVGQQFLEVATPIVITALIAYLTKKES